MDEEQLKRLYPNYALKSEDEILNDIVTQEEIEEDEILNNF